MSDAPSVEGAGRRSPGVRRGDLLSGWLRSFWIHGSWNHRTLLAPGLAFALLPVLRRVHAGDPVRLREALERHLETFNAHPYLATMAVGALARLEAAEVEPATIRRFRTAAGAPLGALGDRAIWSSWRPSCLLASVGVYCLGWNPLAAVTLFVLLYNAGHIWVRIWGFVTGWRAGLDLGRRLRESHLHGVARVLGPAAVVLLGAVGLGLVMVVQGPVTFDWRWPSVLVAAGLVGARWPVLGRWLAPMALAAAPLVWWVAG